MHGEDGERQERDRRQHPAVPLPDAPGTNAHAAARMPRRWERPPTGASIGVVARRHERQRPRDPLPLRLGAR